MIIDTVELYNRKILYVGTGMEGVAYLMEVYGRAYAGFGKIANIQTDRLTEN